MSAGTREGQVLDRNAADGCAACAGPGSFFSPLSDEEHTLVLARSSQRRCRRGQVLYFQGEELTHLFCVKSGQIKLLKTDARGHETVIRFLGPGDVTGFRPLLAGEATAAAAECVTAVDLCLVPRAVFLKLALESRPFSRHLLALLARELRDSEERWAARAGETASRRVARLLGQLMGHDRAAGPGGVVIEVPKQEIARAVDVTPSTLSRILGRFAERGILQIGTRRLIILAPDRLPDPPD
ncbi:MAG: Crp/Fnr family transcriptional regulator [bacterium]|jgi:CRP/FNR family transcriptional regulator|nr:Crp/Fnr family transcriptional regulator [bacterium]